jgi:hypothetical protein
VTITPALARGIYLGDAMKTKAEKISLGAEFARLQAAGYSQSEIAKQYITTRDHVKDMLREYHNGGQPPEFDVIHLGTPLELIGDALIVGDVHVPSTDYEFASLVGRVAEKRGIQRLIIGGDFFNHDCYSRFPHIAMPPTWKEERDAGRKMLQDWLITFDEIVILMGNHDRLKQKAAAGEFDETDIFGMLTTSTKIQLTNFGYLYLNSGGERWYIAHGREYSVNPGTVGNVLAQKYQCHVLSHHQHHFCKMRDAFDRYNVVDNGSLLDITKTAYMYLDSSKKPNSKRGFTVIRAGVPQLYGPWPFTDWGEICPPCK